jgi:hypothetical protein
VLDAVEGLGFRVRHYHPVLDAVEGLGFRVWDSPDRDEGLVFMDYG